MRPDERQSADTATPGEPPAHLSELRRWRILDGHAPLVADDSVVHG